MLNNENNAHNVTELSKLLLEKLDCNLLPLDHKLLLLEHVKKSISLQIVYDMQNNDLRKVRQELEKVTNGSQPVYQIPTAIYQFNIN